MRPKVAMRTLAAALLLGCGIGSAQGLLDPARIPPWLRDFELAAKLPKLDCQVREVRPGLDFGFRFQAGYLVQVPLRQFTGPGHAVAVLARVTPEGRGPVYLGTRLTVPNAPPKTKAQGAIGGRFQIGEGRYEVDLLVADDTGRACRKRWSIQAGLGRSERSVKLHIPPHTVWPLGRRESPESDSGNGGPALERVSILLHVAPASPFRVRLRGQDRMLLVSAVAALTDVLPARRLRIVAFSMAQQAEIFRADSAGMEDISRLAERLNQVELLKVDYRVVQNPRGHLDTLGELIRAELDARERADAVVVIGPMARQSGKLPEAAVERDSAAAPHFLYLQYRPVARALPGFPDAIQLAMKRLQGKTQSFHSPGEFAEAVARFRKSLAAP